MRLGDAATVTLRIVSLAQEHCAYMYVCIPFKPEEMIRGVPSYHLVDIQEVKETIKINCLANYMPVQPYL